MRIELDVDLSRRVEPPLASDDATRAEQLRLTRENRHLRRIALAQHIDHLVQSGQVESYAEVIGRVYGEATRGGFARRRGRILPPADLRPVWRHYVPQSARRLVRRLRGGPVP